MALSPTDKQLFGQAGATMLTGTDSVTADICAILIIEDAIFDGHHATDKTVWAELTDVSGTNTKMLLRSDSADDGVTIPNGITIVGQFSAVKLRQGTVLCYHAA